MRELPDHLSKKLGAEARIGHNRGVLEVIEEIGEVEPDAKPELLRMAANYDFMGIVKLLPDVMERGDKQEPSLPQA